MAKKRKTLVYNMQEIIDGGNPDDFKAVFDKCEIWATAHAKSTCNAFCYRGLTPAHIQFLIDEGLDPNGDCGYGYTAVAHQAHDIDNIKCLLANGADINLELGKHNGGPLALAVSCLNAAAVENLLVCGADAAARGDMEGRTLLDSALRHCDNAYIIKALKICRLLMDAGVTPTGETAENVRRIGERFEFFREEFDPETVDKYSDALEGMYALFRVEPVPRLIRHDNEEKITVKSKRWQKQHEELWNMLVQPSGAAKTVQGEMIRIIGKVLYEILDNGGMNWDDDYRKMIAYLKRNFERENGLERRLCDEACRLITRVSGSADKRLLYRLNKLVVKWVLANPEPEMVGTLEYKR